MESARSPSPSSVALRPVVTGMGVLSPIGANVPAFWNAIANGRHGIATVTRFALEGFTVRLAAALPPGDYTERFERAPSIDDADATEAYALHACREAMANAGLPSGVEPERIGLIVGTSAGPLWSRSVYELSSERSPAFLHAFFQKVILHRATANVARTLGIRGPTLTVSTACTSSALAIAHACEWLEQGLCDVVIAGGVDVLLPETLGGFHAMGAMCPVPCAPFSEPVGMTVGEGAGFVVLETAASARSRRVHPHAIVAGHGAAVDGYHATAPDPGGSGVARATVLALVHAGIEPAAVGYINAHGTGTDANDAAEMLGLRRALGDRADRVPVSSTKSYFGHTLGAAGALEFIATVLAMENGVVPPTLNFTRPRGSGPVDPVAQGAPRAHAYDVALSVNAGFGGHNAALIACAPTRTVPAEPIAPPSGVYILGASVFTSHGDGLDGFDRALRTGQPLARTLTSPPGARPRPTLVARMPDPDPARVARGVDARGLDQIARALLAATAGALAAGGIKPRGTARERVGLYAVLSGVSPDSERVFWDSVRERGHARLSAPAFARIVTNTPAGAVSRALSLLGPSSVMIGRTGTTLAALVLAQHRLSRGRELDALALAAAAVVSDDMLEDRAFEAPPGSEMERARLALGEAAVGIALGAHPGAGRRVRVAGCGSSGPDGLGRAVREACVRAGVDRPGISLVYRATGPGGDDDAIESRGLADALGSQRAQVRICEPARVFGHTDANDAIALIAAREALVRGEVHPGEGPWEHSAPRVALVVSARGDEGAHAVVLTLEGA